jgi:purine-binding chemotaxis protein CheW
MPDIIDDIEEMDAHELPWLIFTLHGNAYAINSKFVSGILVPPPVTPLPEAPDIYKGLVDIRGDVFPLLEVRKLFHFNGVEEECAEFDGVIDGFKDAHIHWVGEMKRCATENAAFLLPTDAAKCDYAVWFEEYKHKPYHPAAAFLGKVEEPHKLLHKTAETIAKLSKEGRNRDVNELILEQLTLGEKYTQIILGMFDEAKLALRNSFRETVVTLSDGKENLGLLVDEVLGVDKIEMVSDDRAMNKFVEISYFVGVGHNKEKTDKEILIVDEEMLLVKARI